MVDMNGEEAEDPNEGLIGTYVCTYLVLLILKCIYKWSQLLLIFDFENR